MESRAEETGLRQRRTEGGASVRRPRSFVGSSQEVVLEPRAIWNGSGTWALPLCYVEFSSRGLLVPGGLPDPTQREAGICADLDGRSLGFAHRLLY